MAKIDKENSPEDETWKYLTKEYLTTDQKLDIIHEYNSFRSQEEWNAVIESLREYLEKRKKSNER